MKNFVTAEWLYAHLNDHNIVIADCRGDLFDAGYGKKVYDSGHIKSAKFVDINKDLSKKTDGHGGRHPMPDVFEFRNKVEELGISNDTIVVAYDELRIAGAARFLWLLKYIGHEKLYLLDGGINKWIQSGYSLELDSATSQRGQHSVNMDKDILADVTYIRAGMNKEGFVIIDSRTPKRYRGEMEPIDKKAGHIPGAKNYYWKENLKDTGEVKEIQEIEDKFKSIKDYKEIAVHCGSGIDATFNFFLMDELGFKPKVYIGSWSDWISYDENEIATGEDK